MHADRTHNTSTHAARAHAHARANASHTHTRNTHIHTHTHTSIHTHFMHPWHCCRSLVCLWTRTKVVVGLAPPHSPPRFPLPVPCCSNGTPHTPALRARAPPAHPWSRSTLSPPWRGSVKRAIRRRLFQDRFFWRGLGRPAAAAAGGGPGGRG